MGDVRYFAVFLFPHAIESIGTTISTYLRQGPPDVHLLASSIDTSGPLFAMVVPGQGPEGVPIDIELMLPHQFVRLVMSVRDEQSVGFI